MSAPHVPAAIPLVAASPIVASGAWARPLRLQATAAENASASITQLGFGFDVIQPLPSPPRPADDEYVLVDRHEATQELTMSDQHAASGVLDETTTSPSLTVDGEPAAVDVPEEAYGHDEDAEYAQYDSQDEDTPLDDEFIGSGACADTVAHRRIHNECEVNARLQGGRPGKTTGGARGGEKAELDRIAASVRAKLRSSPECRAAALEPIRVPPTAPVYQYHRTTGSVLSVYEAEEALERREMTSQWIKAGQQKLQCRLVSRSYLAALKVDSTTECKVDEIVDPEFEAFRRRWYYQHREELEADFRRGSLWHGIVSAGVFRVRRAVVSLARQREFMAAVSSTMSPAAPASLAFAERDPITAASAPGQAASRKLTQPNWTLEVVPASALPHAQGVYTHRASNTRIGFNACPSYAKDRLPTTRLACAVLPLASSPSPSRPRYHPGSFNRKRHLLPEVLLAVPLMPLFAVEYGPTTPLTEAELQLFNAAAAVATGTANNSQAKTASVSRPPARVRAPPKTIVPARLVRDAATKARQTEKAASIALKRATRQDEDERE